MARVTIEDALAIEPNRFALVHLTAQRVRQLSHGDKHRLEGMCDNKFIVTALREIEDKKVRFMTPKEQAAFEAEMAAAAQSAAAVAPLPAPAASDDSDNDDEAAKRRKRTPSA